MRQRQGGLAISAHRFLSQPREPDFPIASKTLANVWSTILQSYIAKVAFRRVLQILV